MLKGLWNDEDEYLKLVMTPITMPKVILPEGPVVISSGAVTDDPWPNHEEYGPREA